MGEVADVGEGVDVLRVGDELGEVFVGEIRDEVGFQDDDGGVAVKVLVEGVGRDVRVVDDGGARSADQVDGRLEGGEDGGVAGFGGDDVAGDADAGALEGGEVACGDVVGYAGDGRGVVVVRIFPGNGLENVCRILDRASHGTNCVLSLGNRDDQSSAYESYCGLDADQIGNFTRTQDTSTCLCSP